jgi:hypothetical protein
MNQADDTTCEQLSAWMDGELSPEEARFLERRLQNDPELRAKWERLQLASSCLRGHRVLAMPGLADRVVASLDAAPPQASRRPLLGWAIAASVAALAIAFVPRMVTTPEAPAIVEQPAGPVVVPTAPLAAPAPTPGSADFIAEAPAVEPAPTATPGVLAAAPVGPVAPVASGPTQSPTDFPLADAARPTTWPRPGLPGSEDAAMEGYLVRHNEMAGADALGGFVQYIDVVAAGKPESMPARPDEAAPPAAKDDKR